MLYVLVVGVGKLERGLKKFEKANEADTDFANVTSINKLIDGCGSTAPQVSKNWVHFSSNC